MARVKCEKMGFPTSRAASYLNRNDYATTMYATTMNEIFDEYGNYIYPADVVLDEPNTVIGYFRYTTKEEADSVNRYINSISSQTGVNFYDIERVVGCRPETGRVRTKHPNPIRYTSFQKH